MVKQIGIEPNPAKRIRNRQGDNLRKIRQLRDITVVELAASIDVTVGAVSQWENGRYTPSPARQVKIAQALNVPWSTLFGLDGEVAA